MRRSGTGVTLATACAAISALAITGAAMANPPETAPPPTAAPAVANETILTFPSRIAKRSYRIQIFRPLLPPPEGYPVIFVADGSGMFRTAADQMWAREYADLKPAIVVGLSQPTNEIKEFIRLRTWDFTPEKPNEAFMPTFKLFSVFSPVSPDDAGGAESFYRFITEELRPQLARTYPIDMKDQALFGHSLGGLFVLHVLFNHPTAFGTYIASSPSIIWNAGSVLKAEPAFSRAVASGSITPRILFEKGGLEAGFEVRALADRLKALHGAARYEVGFHDFDGENHNSVTAAATARALTFAFNKPLPAAVGNVRTDSADRSK